MKKGLIVSAIVGIGMCLVASSVQAELGGDGVITTGKKTGTYIKVGYALKGQLPGTTVIHSKGSIENLQRILKDEASIAVVQMDAYAFHSSSDAETETKAEIMGPLYEECLFMAVNTSKNSKVRDEDDLQNVKGVKIAVDKKGSGTAVTWDYMRQLEPKYKNAKVIFKGGNRMLGKLALGGKTAPDAVMWMGKPNLNGKLAQSVLKNENLEFIDVDDNQLNNKFEATGEPIYRFKKIKSSGGLFGGSVNTICTDAALVANADWDEDKLEQLSDLVLNYKSSIVPE